MIILEDSRQQLGKHDIKHKWFADNGIEVVRTKLYVGDYTFPTDQSVCVDTKKDFGEIINNITSKVRTIDEADGKKKTAIQKEADRAARANIRLVYLIENDGGEVKKGSGIYNPVITKLEDVHKWKNPRLFIMDRGKQKFPNAIRGIKLQKILHSFAEHHGCEFQFCHSRDSAKRIVEILTGKETE